MQVVTVLVKQQSGGQSGVQVGRRDVAGRPSRNHGLHLVRQVLVQRTVVKDREAAVRAVDVDRDDDSRDLGSGSQPDDVAGGHQSGHHYS